MTGDEEFSEFDTVEGFHDEGIENSKMEAIGAPKWSARRFAYRNVCTAT